MLPVGTTAPLSYVIRQIAREHPDACVDYDECQGEPIERFLLDCDDEETTIVVHGPLLGGNRVNFVHLSVPTWETDETPADVFVYY